MVTLTLGNGRAIDGAFIEKPGMTSPMIALKAHYDGKVLVPEEPVTLSPNQKVLLQIQPIDSPDGPKSKRVFGQQPGAFTYVAPDFDEPHPDCFWLGEASTSRP